MHVLNALTETTEPSTSRIPMSLKVGYTAFMAVLVPYYLHAYGPANFLWFCDVALVVTLIALWTESRFLASTQAVAIVLPQLLWCADFLFGLVSGGQTLVGMATYMFNDSIPLFVRGLSLFHGWLPFLLLWLVWRLGYDRKALWFQIGLSWVVLLAAFVLLPGPTTAAGNVNKVFGWGNEMQSVMSPLLWLGIVMAAYPLLFYVPSHLIYSRIVPVRSALAAESGE